MRGIFFLLLYTANHAKRNATNAYLNARNVCDDDFSAANLNATSLRQRKLQIYICSCGFNAAMNFLHTFYEQCLTFVSPDPRNKYVQAYVRM